MRKAVTLSNLDDLLRRLQAAGAFGEDRVIAVLVNSSLDVLKWFTQSVIAEPSAGLNELFSEIIRSKADGVVLIENHVAAACDQDWLHRNYNCLQHLLEETETFILDALIVCDGRVRYRFSR